MLPADSSGRQMLLTVTTEMFPQTFCKYLQQTHFSPTLVVATLRSSLNGGTLRKSVPALHNDFC